MAQTLCDYTFVRGKNKGNQCGKANCKLHAKKTFSLANLPELVLHNIFDIMITDCVYLHNFIDLFKKFKTIEQSCKYLYEIIQTKYEMFYTHFCQHISMRCFESYMSELNHKQKLSLLLETGCMSCDTPKVHKVHWPFPIRVCKDCLYDMTFSEYKFKAEFPEFVKNNPNWNQDLRYIRGNLWSNYYGSYHLNFYLKSDLDKVMGEPVFKDLEKRRKQIATELGTTLSELMKISSHIHTYNLNKSIIEEQYFKHKAQEKIKECRYGNNVLHLDLTQNIKTKEDYEQFLSQDIAKIIEERCIDSTKKSYIASFITIAKKTSKYISSNINLKYLQKHFECIKTFCDTNHTTMESLERDYKTTIDTLNDILNKYEIHVNSELERIISNNTKVIEYIKKKIDFKHTYKTKIKIPKAIIISDRLYSTYDQIYEATLKPCSFCKNENVLYNEDELEEHLNKDHIYRFTCEICKNGIYYSKEKLNSHMNNAHKFRFKCKYCPSTCSRLFDENGIKCHQRSVHKII